MLLAIDTATRTASIALYDEGVVIAEETWRVRENHTTSLTPELLRLMQASGVGIEDVRALGVATGPGSFTGLRIGLSLAKGLALSRELPLIGVPTLDGLAYSFAGRVCRVWALIEAGRGRFTGAVYQVRIGAVEREGEYLTAEPQQWTRTIRAWLDQTSETMPESGAVVVAGEIDARLRAILVEALGPRVMIANPAANARRAAYLAELAWARWQLKQIESIEALAPYYIPTASLPTV